MINSLWLITVSLHEEHQLVSGDVPDALRNETGTVVRAFNAPGAGS